MYLIGLTGNIACGKSSVVAMLRELGAHVRDADTVTHELMAPAGPAYPAIVAAFGQGILSAPGGPIDRRALGRIVFADARRLADLEEIIHPLVRVELERWLGELERAGATVAVIDAIKLIERGWPARCDAVWVVTCLPEQQLERLVQQRGMQPDEARARIAAQGSQEAKLAYATIAIDNSGSLEQTRRQVLDAWSAIPVLNSPQRHRDTED